MLASVWMNRLVMCRLAHNSNADDGMRFLGSDNMLFDLRQDMQGCLDHWWNLACDSGDMVARHIGKGCVPMYMHGIRLHTKHTHCLFRMYHRLSAGDSDGDDEMSTPWIIQVRFGLDMRVPKATLCIDETKRETHLTWFPPFRKNYVPMYTYMATDLRPRTHRVGLCFA